MPVIGLSTCKLKCNGVVSLVHCHLERDHKIVVDVENGAAIVVLATVIGGREDGDQTTIGKELVAILHL